MISTEIVPINNGFGWTSTVPNQITCAVIDHLSNGGAASCRVLDIGVGLGVATIPLLKTGAAIIANDLEESHLRAIREAAAARNLQNRLETVLGRFPDEVSFRDLDAIHCSNVLHFLSGEEIDRGARRMHDWLKPGGAVFIQAGTIYAGHIRRLVPIFEERRRQGIRWAGETDSARGFVLAEFADATPLFMNYLDGPPLVESFEAAGFVAERAWYYTRTGLPEVFCHDGREHFGYIGLRK